MLARVVFVSVCLSSFAFNCDAFVSQSLNGEWDLRDASGKYELTASVPGGIYTDLMRNNIIGDVFYGFNDVETRWVAKLTWNYTREFNVTPELLQHENKVLILEGVDTFASIYLNGALIGGTDNMFVRYEFDLSGLLRATNHLSVVFDSPIAKSQSLYNEQAENYVVPPKCVPDLYNGECHVNHIRKMQASFAWDWGPALPSVGLWKNVTLNAYNSTYIKDVTISITPQGNDYNFKLTIYAAAPQTTQTNKNLEKQLTGVMKVQLAHRHQVDLLNFDLNEKTTRGEFVINKEFTMPQDKFDLWWPNGFGAQPLYPMTISLENSGEIVTKTIRFGIREVTLEQKPVGSGLSFQFKVNQIALFAKGSNMAPSHILPEHSNNVTILKRLLQTAKDTHMNMIRVWGGGLYESDAFYELADEMGIMIWQDFMFACSMYPTNDAFLKTVSAEVEHQVRRLQHHASLVLWAGNNENEAALRFNWYGTIWNQSVYEADYRQLYARTIRDVVHEVDPSRSYLSSSPTNGLKSEEEGFIAKNPQDNAYGDVHYYNYILDSWNINIYPIPRFASEYGYQALPSYKSLLSATNNESDLFIGSDFMQHRQHHPMGYTEMEFLIRLRLQLPPKTNSVPYNKAFIYYSQIVQAMAIKIETEHYRQWRSYLNTAGNGLTMGALYWQLNCPWLAPTWSGVDSTGKWKMLQYYAKEFFAPLIVTSHLYASQSADIYVVSDLLRPVFNASLTVSIHRWNSLIVVNKKTRLVDIHTGSLKVTTINLKNFLGRNELCGVDPMENCFVQLSVAKDDKQIAPDNYIFPIALKNSAVEAANVQIESIEGISPNKFRIWVMTDKPAVFVWLESTIDGKFSENGFAMLQQYKEIVFEAQGTSDEVLRSLSITHLKDTLYFTS